MALVVHVKVRRLGSELCLSRPKPGETLVEGRSGSNVQIARWDYGVNLSISLAPGKENNRDSPSSGERKGNCPRRI